MSDDIAEDQIAAFVDRILRLKAEADDIAADIKEIYAEAHGNGLNKTRLGEIVTYLRKVEKDKDGVAEAEAIRDLYLEAYYRAKNKPHTHAYAREAKNALVVTTKNASISGLDQPKTGNVVTTTEIPEHDADGVIIEPRDPAPDSAQMLPVEAAGLPADDGIATSPAGAEGIVDRQPIQPETATQSLGDGDTAIGTGNAVVGAVNGTVLLPTPQGAADGTPHRSGVTAGETATNITTLRQPKPLRPNCLKPEMCGGQGRQHCWACEKAATQRAGTV